jgi:hypothetical protein
VILAATLNAVPSIPAIGLVLVLSVDWFIGMARALGNLIGNCIATVVIAAWGAILTTPLLPASASRAAPQMRAIEPRRYLACVTQAANALADQGFISSETSKRYAQEAERTDVKISRLSHP